ncbi:MAG: lamin tail domain-containing protein [Flavobacteriales bacterium]
MKTFSVLFVCFSFIQLNAQIVISEFLYNDPGSGNDSLEFIELYNYTDSDLELTNYSISDGVSFTFPQYTLNSKSYVVISKYPETLKRVFNITNDNLFAWSDTGSVSLNNNGEIIQLSNSSGVVVDEVEYFANAEWHDSQADGGGYSIEICDFNIDNNIGANWTVSPQTGNFIYTGFDPIIEDQLTSFNVYASPNTGCFTTNNIFNFHNTFSGKNTFTNYLNVPKNSKIFNINGQHVYTTKSTNEVVQTSHWRKGIYVLKNEQNLLKIFKY